MGGAATTGTTTGTTIGTSVRTPLRSTMREMRYEETNWKARPDWSRDGKRVVYASYLGRQWHQLWLTTPGVRMEGEAGREAVDESGDAYQLTYGDFDATNPRWSPDGRTIAYISNEGGNTSLWTVSVPAGQRRAVVARHRRFLRPSGAVRVIVTDAATGALSSARLSVRGADGRHFAPDDAWMQADDAFDRQQRRFEFAYFHAASPVIVTLPAGPATIEVTRGVEYAHEVRQVNVRAGDTTTVRVKLSRLSDLASRGWVSGDLHVHMNYGGTYRNTPERLVAQASAEGLRVVENLIVNKEGRIPDVAYFTGRPDRASTNTVLLVHDEEFHTSYWGHTGLLGLSRQLVLPTYAAYINTAAQSLAPMNAEVMRLAREQGGVGGYVHPFDAWPDPADISRPLTNEFPVDLALGMIDYYETLGFVDDFMVNQRVWYAALNAGFRLPAGAGTDAMANFASLRGPVGMNRVYARVKGALTHRRFLDALKAGRTFATNGPLLEFTLNGRGIGDDIALSRGQHTLRARVSLRSFVAIDSLEIVSNGKVVARVAKSADGKRADAVVELPVASSAWFLLRAWSAGGRHPVLDVMPMGTTSPIYVTVGGAAIQSAPDAMYFLSWVDRLRSNVLAFTGWNDTSERTETLARIDSARAELVRRASRK